MSQNQILGFTDDISGQRVTYSELESLDETDGFIDRTTDGEIVDSNLAENTLGVNDEETTESNTLVLDEDTVVTRDLHVSVSNERELEVRAETTLVAGR